MVRRTVVLILSALIIFAPYALASDEGSKRIHMDADKISFDDATGVALAEGSVVIRNDEMRLYAPFVEYDTEGNRVTARSTHEGRVTFSTPAGRLNADSLEYDIKNRRGTLTSPNGKVDEFYVRGSKLEVMPISEVTGVTRRVVRDVSSDDMGAVWNEAVVTTCDRPEPHYRFEAKSITVLQGESITISRPDVYIGKSKIFSYPFDHRISLIKTDRRSRQTILPVVGYESNKGAGLGVGIGKGWSSGYAELEAIGWTKGIWEGSLSITQDLTEDLSLYTNIGRSYNKDDRTTAWRPSWGLRYGREGGWQADLRWSQRELLTMQKRSGSDQRYVVWKEPELNIMSPWYDDAATGGKFRLLGSAGRYEDATYRPGQKFDRLGLGAQLAGDFSASRDGLRPFYNAVFWHYRYSDHDEDQSILEGVLGLKWQLGKFDMESAYLRRWAWGSSPMMWDSYDDIQEIYQEIGYTFPTNDKDINWKLAVRAAYDIDERKISETVYKVAYDMHCLLWEAIYRSDRDGSDNWFGLKVTMNAFPDSGAWITGSPIFDPEKAPNELVPLESSDRKNE